MNSFALLQDEVEDDGAAVATLTPDVDAGAAPNGAAAPQPNGTPATAADDKGTSAAAADGAQQGDSQQQGDAEPARKERDLTLEEYFQQKAALSSGLAPLNSRSARKANEGGNNSVAKMSVLKKADAAADVLDGVAVKTLHETKALKDSTHATVARNAEIQKFFQRDPNERRPSYAGRGRGRGGYHDDYRSGGGRGGGYSRGGRGGGPGGYYDRDRGNSVNDANNADGGRRFDRPRSDRFDRDRPGFRGGYRGGYRGGFRGGDDRAAADHRAAAENGDATAASNTTAAAAAAPAAGDDAEEAGNKQRFERSGSGHDRFERAGSGGAPNGDRFERGPSGDRFERPDYHRGDRYDSNRGGRGRYDSRGRGRGRGRGGYHSDGYRPHNDRKFAPKAAVVAPNVDDTVAFPSL